MACAARCSRKPASTWIPSLSTGIYKNMPRGIIALVFRCKITGGVLTTSDESAAFRWAAQNEIRDLASEAYAIRIMDAFHESPTPAVRQHDGIRLL